ncbi:hypothetical protein MP228_004199 [Amoeboaphelidium protococcarum]|nr:hypothetical protein MP228_004199 [Amoeboaphelidium protococcarum]
MRSIGSILILVLVSCSFIDGTRDRRTADNSTTDGTSNQAIKSPPSPVAERAANPAEQPAPRSSSGSTGKPADSPASNSSPGGVGNQAQSTRSLDDCMATAKYNECRKCLACPPGATCAAVIPPECDEIRRQCERYSQGSGSIPPAYRCNKPPSNPSPPAPNPSPVSRPANPTETPPSRPIPDRPGNQAAFENCLAAVNIKECDRCHACPPGATCAAVAPPVCIYLSEQCKRYSQGSGSIPPAYRCNKPPSNPSPPAPNPSPVSRPANPTETPPSRPIFERPDGHIGIARSLSDCIATTYQACINCRSGQLTVIPPECEPLQKDCEDYSKGLIAHPPAYRCDNSPSNPSPTIPRPGSRPDPSFIPMPVPMNDTTRPQRPRQWGHRDPRPSPVPTPLPFNNGSFSTPGPPSSSPQPSAGNNYDPKIFADCEYEVYEACNQCRSGRLAKVDPECAPLREQCSRASAKLQPVPPPYVCPWPVEKSPRPPYPSSPPSDTEAGRSESRKFYIACLQNSYGACRNCLVGPLSADPVPECDQLATQCDAATRGTGPVPPPYACRNFPTPPPPPPRPPLAPPQGNYPDHLTPPPSRTNW